MGEEETERFGDKQRMTKTERGRANKRKPVCMYVYAGSGGACSVMCTAARG